MFSVQFFVEIIIVLAATDSITVVQISVVDAAAADGEPCVMVALGEVQVELEVGWLDYRQMAEHFGRRLHL